MDIDQNICDSDNENQTPGANEANRNRPGHLIGNEVAQKLVQNAFNFSKKFPDLSTDEVTADCLGLSVMSVKKYKNGPVPRTTQVPHRKRSKPQTSDVSLNLKIEIRNVIYDMYARKIAVTLATLKEELENRELYHASQSSLARLLKEIGFTYKKDDPRRSLMEKPHVRHSRYSFLKSHMADEEMKEQKKPYVYLDETWVFANGSVSKSWQDHDVRSVKQDKGDGARYIVLHAGTEKGFIEGANFIFKSRQNQGDYHGEMNSKNFEMWLKDLLSVLEEPSIIIMDNASYHSRQLNKLPTKSSKKEVMQVWLRERNVLYSETATKDFLWNLVCQFPKSSKSFVTDSMIQSAGHEVLRLPPYHCQFNAIEMVWSQAKRFYDKEVLANKDVLDTWKRAISNVTPSQWANYVEHTDKVIKSAWEKEKNISTDVQPIVINIGYNDDDSDMELGSNSD